VLALKGFPMMTEFAQQELEQRLNLYQAFLKLYEHKRTLLEELTQLEERFEPSLTKPKMLYLQGVIKESTAYVITNICNETTKTLQQSQGIWTIGRDGSNGINLLDKHLSRNHAAIQYIDNQGFYLIDLGSTNGSYVNGEPIYQRTKLKDGDTILLGTITFSFFLDTDCEILPEVENHLIKKITSFEYVRETVPANTLFAPSLKAKPLVAISPQTSSDDLSEKTATMFKDSSFTEKLGEKLAGQYMDLIAQDQSEILDRFFNKQISNL
jgi:pSer/pThr/pTyr-binding forkhead associated (FHA) protein